MTAFTSCAHARFPVSEHSDGQRFYNEDRDANISKGFFELLKWQLTGDRKTWPDWVDDNVKPDFKKELKAGEGAVTTINHATHVIQVQGLTAITDPVFSERVSPFTWLGPKRHRPPGASIADLPKIDIVLISHNHYDHLDTASIQALEERDHPTFFVPLGCKELLDENGVKNVIELNWWEESKLPGGAIVTLVPMQHWSGRGLGDRFKTLWGGFVLQSQGLKVLFSGDTGYGRHFKAIGEKFGAMDLSIIPIGAYEPRWFMKEQHMNPYEAVQAHIDLKSKFSVGTHFGTFQLTDEGIDEPIEHLKQSLGKAGITEEKFLAPKNGQTILFRL